MKYFYPKNKRNVNQSYVYSHAVKFEAKFKMIIKYVQLNENKIIAMLALYSSSTGNGVTQIWDEIGTSMNR